MVGNGKFESALKLYKRVVTPALVEATLENTAIAYEQRGGIFSTAVVVWLMIFQRLSGDHTLARAIEHLKTEDVREALISGDARSIKARHGRISSATGGYSHGRQRVPLSVVESITDSLNEEIPKADLHDKQGKSQAEKVYSIDGTTMFESQAANLVAGDTNGLLDIFLRDLTKTGVQTLSGVVVSNKASAEITLDLAQRYRAELLDYRSKLGATTSRIATFVNTLQSSTINYKAASSRITDADIAEEAAKSVASGIRQQVAASLLGQANQAPQIGLQLLRNA